MNRSLVKFAALVVPLAAALPPSASAQEAFTVRFQRCAQLGIAVSGDDTVVVEQVRPGSPAARAGIRPADRVVAINGETVTGEKLQVLRAQWRPGVAVRVRLLRHGEVQEVDVVPTSCSVEVWRQFSDSAYRELARQIQAARLALDSVMERVHRRELQRFDSLRQSWAQAHRRMAEEQRELVEQLRQKAFWDALPVPGYPDALPIAVYVGQHAIAGVEFTELNPQLAEYFQGATSGLLVLRVAPGSPGARAGLRPGDVVFAANDDPIYRIRDLRSAIAGAGKEPVTLSIVRHGKEQRLVYRYED